MIILSSDECPQGSEAWHKARAGVVTASEMDKIRTPAKGKPSAQAEVYMNTLLMEWLIGGPTEAYSNSWMDRGKEVEAEARAEYAFQADAQVQEVGFVYMDEQRLVGCSPDGLVGDDGLVELKCPKASTQIDYMLRPGVVPPKYNSQIQAQLMVTGRAWCDFNPYFPGVKTPTLRVFRDERMIMDLKSFVVRFVADMLERREQLKKLGYQPANYEEDVTST